MRAIPFYRQGTHGAPPHCCRMTTFFFDNEGSADIADEGLDLPDVETALSAALRAFPDMIRDREPMSDQTRFRMTVRSASGPLFQITLDLLPGSSSSPQSAGADEQPPRPAIGAIPMNSVDDLVAAVAKRHDAAPEAVSAAWAALRRGGGTRAQFNHPEFGGMAQWSEGGMSMVGDMFNNAVKTKFDGVMADLAAAIQQDPSEAPFETGSLAPVPPTAMFASRWPDAFGAPSSSGCQNDMSYAFFPKVGRLIVEDGAKRTIYDTGKHRISGVSQQQAGSRSVRFRSQAGDVDLDDLAVAAGETTG
jgi:hypothetical protein